MTIFIILNTHYSMNLTTGSPPTEKKVEKAEETKKIRMQ